MEDGCRGGIVDLPTLCTEPITEIDLFLIQKIRLVEAPDRRKCVLPDGECSTEHPVNSSSPPFMAVRAEKRSHTSSP
jgi:hypothetical protein